MNKQILIKECNHCKRTMRDKEAFLLKDINITKFFKEIPEAYNGIC